MVKPQGEMDHCPDHHWHVYGAATAAQRKKLKMPPGPRFSYLPTAAPDLNSDRKTTTTTVPVVTGTLIDKMDGYRHCRCWVDADIAKYHEVEADTDTSESDADDEDYAITSRKRLNKSKRKQKNGDGDKKEEKGKGDKQGTVDAGEMLRFVHNKWRFGTYLFPNFDVWKRRQVKQAFEALPVDIQQRWFAHAKKEFRYKPPRKQSSSSPSFQGAMCGTSVTLFGSNIECTFKAFYLRSFIVEEVLSALFNAPTDVSPASIVSSYLVPLCMDCITAKVNAPIIHVAPASPMAL